MIWNGLAKFRVRIIILDIITVGIVANVKKVIRRYYETIYASKCDSFYEIIPNLHRKNRKPERFDSIKETEPIFIKLPIKKTPHPDNFASELFQNVKSK